MADLKKYLGRYKHICDKSGFTVFFEDTRKEWNGLRVDKRFYEDRHPQDKIKTVVEQQRVPDPRPEGEWQFITTRPTPEDL